MNKRTFSLQRLKIKTKFHLGLSAVILCLGLTLGIISTHIASTELIKENKERGKVLSSNLAYRAEEPLLTQDFLRLKSLVEEMLQTNTGLAYAFIRDKSGRIMAHTFEKGIPVDLLHLYGKKRDISKFRSTLLLTQEGKIYDFANPIKLQGQRLGTVRLGMYRQRVESMIKRLSLWIFGFTGVITTLALVVASWFCSKFTNRIKVLTQSANEMVKGNLGVRSAPVEKENCWQIKNCQVTSCPAYHITEQRCWNINTNWSSREQNRESGKMDFHCLKCPIYHKNSGDEIQELSEAFDYMAMTLEERIDKLEQTERELSKQKEVLSTILDVTPDMVALQDKNLCYQAVNKSFCSYFQISEEEVLGKTDFDIFTEYQADLNYHEDMQILKTGSSLSKEIRIAKGEMATWFHIRKVPVYTEGQISGLLLTARDISVIKQYQEHLVQSQKMEDLGRLAGGVAHEINTPLGIILGYAQMLLEDVDKNDQMAEDLRMIEKQTKICSNIVSDLLGFSRQNATTKSEVDINESMQEVISLVEHTFGLNQVCILKDLDPNIPEIDGDKDKLKQVWLNLLNNAFDAIEQDGCVRIATKLCAHRRRVAITITDTGAGIKQEILNKIFDPFFSTKPVGTGTGLGLSVTFGIIKDHGGRINVLSPAPQEYMQPIADQNQKTGPGTVFLVELPLWYMNLPEEECEEMGFSQYTREK